MATKAFLLVETAVGRTRDVANTLRDLDGIESVDVVTGPYDIIAVISGDDMSVVGGLVTEKIHTVCGTVTCGSTLDPWTDCVTLPAVDGLVITGCSGWPIDRVDGRSWWSIASLRATIIFAVSYAGS